MAAISPGAVLIRPPRIWPYTTFEEAGYSTANAAQGTALTPSASANTKGSYAQLIASTATQTRMIDLTLTAFPVGANSKSYLIDIATGGAGSEVVLIPDVCVAVKGAFSVCIVNVRLPVAIPAGVRIAARCQTQAASGEACWAKAILETGVPSFAGVDNLSASTATSLGVAITPGNAAESSYVELIASTSRAYAGFFATIDPQGAGGGTFPVFALDFATGAAASEVVFKQNHMSFYLDGIVYPATVPFFAFPVAASTRIAARARGSGASSAIGVSLYGVY
jgi:hypothetical protein